MRFCGSNTMCSKVSTGSTAERGIAKSTSALSEQIGEGTPRMFQSRLCESQAQNLQTSPRDQPYFSFSSYHAITRAKGYHVSKPCPQPMPASSSCTMHQLHAHIPYILHLLPSALGLTWTTLHPYEINASQSSDRHETYVLQFLLGPSNRLAFPQTHATDRNSTCILSPSCKCKVPGLKHAMQFLHSLEILILRPGSGVRLTADRELRRR